MKTELRLIDAVDKKLDTKKDKDFWSSALSKSNKKVPLSTSIEYCITG